jgi:Protein of unknown function (DUF1173)
MPNSSAQTASTVQAPQAQHDLLQPASDGHGQRFAVIDKVFSGDDPGAEALLAAAHTAKQRPLCLCLEARVPMYIAHVGDRFIVKRMPNTGHLHAPDCPSFDPPAELSGLGEVAGSAIQEDLATGATTLRLDFTLAKRGGSRPPVAQGTAPDTVRTDGQKLTLRGTLHYLWDQAELNRWMPGMAGRRSWGVVQRRLVAAAQNKFAKGDPLADVLFVPEPWSQDHKDAIERDRRGQLARLHTHDASGSRLMVVIGELKEFKEARFGSRAVIKHVPEMHLQVPGDLMRRIERHFEKELALWKSEDDSHMILAGTFGVDTAGYANLEAVSLMVTDANWIPIEHRWDLELVRRMVGERRRFTKGMRYNLAPDRPIASAVLADTADGLVALYVVPPSADADAVAQVTTLVDESDIRSWIWHAGGDEIPALPSVSRRTA